MFDISFTLQQFSQTSFFQSHTYVLSMVITANHRVILPQIKFNLFCDITLCEKRLFMITPQNTFSYHISIVRYLFQLIFHIIFNFIYLIFIIDFQIITYSQKKINTIKYVLYYVNYKTIIILFKE